MVAATIALLAGPPFSANRLEPAEEATLAIPHMNEALRQNSLGQKESWRIPLP